MNTETTTKAQELLATIWHYPKICGEVGIEFGHYGATAAKQRQSLFVQSDDVSAATFENWLVGAIYSWFDRRSDGHGENPPTQLDSVRWIFFSHGRLVFNMDCLNRLEALLEAGEWLIKEQKLNGIAGK